MNNKIMETDDDGEHGFTGEHKHNSTQCSRALGLECCQIKEPKRTKAKLTADTGKHSLPAARADPRMPASLRVGYPG